MITVMKWGAMYGQLEEGDVIAPDPLLLGDHIITPGDLIVRIGSVKRTMFEMKDGYSLQYVGKVEKHLLFNSYPTGCCGDPWYYAFAYVDATTLLCGCAKGCRDIRVNELIFSS